MDFFKKLRSSSFKGPKKEGESWGVILKGVPDKKVEEALMHIFTERLDVPGDDALKIIRSSPIILFSDRNAREAEQIKLILNKTGARTAISNDPMDFRTLPRVAWPQKIGVAHLGGEKEIEAPPSPPPSPKSTKPVVPPPPKFPSPQASALPSRPPLPPAPAPPVANEWKIKYENLNQVHTEKIQELQTKLKIFTEERDWAVRERDESKTRARDLEQELLMLKNLKSSLETEKGVLEREKERLIQEKDQVEKALQEIRKELLRSQEMRESLQSEKTMLEAEKARFLQEKELAVSARQQAEKALEEIRRELIRSQETRESLQKELNRLRLDCQRPIPEIEKIKAAFEVQIEAIQKQVEPLKSQVKFFENLLDLLKGSSKPLGPSPKPEAPVAPSPPQKSAHQAPITPPKRPGSGGKGSIHIGIIPPSST